MNTLGKAIIMVILVGFATYFGIGLVGSIENYNDAVQDLDVANKNLGYEYGRCVFYDQISVEECNEFSNNKGLEQYEKYYGDGSWTVDADPDPNN